MVATNKQMVDLTYLCFVFLNDRSDAWWEMQWDACQGRDNSRERARESCIHSQFTPISAVFKVSNFFLWLLLAVARAAVPQPPSLPNYHPHTDRQLMGKTHGVHEEIQFSHETNVLHQGGNMWRSSGRWRRSRSEPSLGSAWDRVWGSSVGVCALAECGLTQPNTVSIYLFIDPFIYSFIYSRPSTRLPCFGCTTVWQLRPPWDKNAHSQQTLFWYFNDWLVRAQ